MRKARRFTYTILSLKNPPYSSSKACGRSQWKRVTNGFMPANDIIKKQVNYFCMHMI
jgi:hypothetical protein